MKAISYPLTFLLQTETTTENLTVTEVDLGVSEILLNNVHFALFSLILLAALTLLFLYRYTNKKYIILYLGALFILLSLTAYFLYAISLLGGTVFDRALAISLLVITCIVGIWEL